MKLIQVFCITLGMMFIYSCGSVTHWTDFEEGTTFEDYRTYKIDEQCSDYNPGINPIHQQRIKNAIELELRSMGYAKAEEADINIKFFVKNETKYFYEECLPEYDEFTGGQRCVERVHTYEEGTLVIDFIDISENLAVWHGGASGESWDRLDNASQKIGKMVRAIIGDYRKLVDGES